MGNTKGSSKWQKFYEVTFSGVPGASLAALAQHANPAFYHSAKRAFAFWRHLNQDYVDTVEAR